MALKGTGSTAQFWTKPFSLPFAAASQYTLSAWMRVDAGGLGGTAMGLGNPTLGPDTRLFMNGGTTYAEVIGGSNNNVPGPTPASGKWFHFMMTVAGYPGLVTGYNNGVAFGSNTFADTWTAPTQLAVGLHGGSGAYSTATSTGISFAECAVWSGLLGPADARALAAGKSPLRIKGGSLLHYSPLRGDLSDLSGSRVGLAPSAAFTPVWTDHPPVELPPKKRFFIKSAGTGTVALTGQTATAAIGTAAPGVTIALTGIAATGAIGSLTPSTGAALSGLSATGAVGTLTPGLSAPLAGNAGTGAIGTLAPSITAPLAGQAATGAVGTVSVAGSSNVTVALTGLGASGAVGALIPSASVGLAGNAATGTAGIVAPGSAAALAGQAAAASIGLLTSATAAALTGRAATGAIGTVTVAAGSNVTVALTGLSATASVGSLAPAMSMQLAGTAGTATIGGVTYAASFALTGNAASGGVGTLTTGTGPQTGITVRDVITRALITANINGVGQSPGPEDINSGFVTLNNMLGLWSKKRWLIYDLVETVKAATGALSYSIGSGGDFAITRPDRLEAAFVRVQSAQGPVDYPLSILQSREDYNRISSKALPAFPSIVFLDSGYPTGTVYLWPVPGAAYEIHLFVKATVGGYANLTDIVSLPAEYMEAIDYNLIMRLCLAYGQQITPEVFGLAKASLETIRGANTQIAQLQTATGIENTRPSGLSAFIAGYQ